MNKIPILITILFFSLEIAAQSDIIYPTLHHRNIRRCEIIDVKKNIVHYQKDGVNDSIEAVAIRKNRLTTIISYGNSVRLYKNHDYNYYLTNYKNELRRRNIGICITGGGLGLVAVGIITFNYYNTNSNETMNPLPYLIGLGAVISTGVGIVIWTTGGISKNKNKRAMYLTKQNLSLSFYSNKNGVGFKLSF